MPLSVQKVPQCEPVFKASANIPSFFAYNIVDLVGKPREENDVGFQVPSFV